MISCVVVINGILFDTGASYGSYLFKDLLECYRYNWPNNIRDKATITLGDNQVILNFEESVTLNLGFKYENKSKKQKAIIITCTLNISRKSIVVGQQVSLNDIIRL